MPVPLLDRTEPHTLVDPVDKRSSPGRPRPHSPRTQGQTLERGHLRVDLADAAVVGTRLALASQCQQTMIDPTCLGLVGAVLASRSIELLHEGLEPVAWVEVDEALGMVDRRGGVLGSVGAGFVQVEDVEVVEEVVIHALEVAVVRAVGE